MCRFSVGIDDIYRLAAYCHVLVILDIRVIRTGILCKPTVGHIAVINIELTACLAFADERTGHTVYEEIGGRSVHIGIIFPDDGTTPGSSAYNMSDERSSIVFLLSQITDVQRDILHHAVIDFNTWGQTISNESTDRPTGVDGAVFYPYLAHLHVARLAHHDGGSRSFITRALDGAVLEGHILNESSAIVCNEAGRALTLHRKVADGVSLTVKLGNEGLFLAQSDALGPFHARHIDIVDQYHLCERGFLGITDVRTVAQQRQVCSIIDVKGPLSERNTGEVPPSVSMTIVLRVGYQQLLVVAVHERVARLVTTEHVVALPLGRCLAQTGHRLQGIIATGKGTGTERRQTGRQRNLRDVGTAYEGKLFYLCHILKDIDARQLTAESEGKAADGGYLVCRAVNAHLARNGEHTTAY